MPTPLHPGIEVADQEILRALAGRLATCAARPEEEEKRKLWYAHNALEATRPLVFCDPENSWNEIIPRDALHCAGTLARSWEWELRVQLFWAESMGDDKPTPDRFEVPVVARMGDWGMRETIIGGGQGGSYTWDAPLKSYADLDKLHSPEIIVDWEETQRQQAAAEAIMEGILPVARTGKWWWTLGLTQTAVRLRGLEQFMLDMCVFPVELKQFMAILRDGAMAMVDFLEENELLSLNNGLCYVGSGGFGLSHELPQSDFSGRVRAQDLWGFAESQETTSVSPEQFAEFVFPYQLPLLSRFGLNCYGCCEPLHLRWDVVKQFPRLRRISVSPWADLEIMAHQLTDQYVFSMKPNPAPLAMPELDEALIRKQLREALAITQGCRVETIMKDTHTIARNPENVIRWCRIAREEADRLT
jgi:hypothetical protein